MGDETAAEPTPIRQPISPADAAIEINGETIELRDVAGALPRIAAELARANALTVQTIRLQQAQIQLLNECVTAIRTGQAAGVDLQRAQLETFSNLFEPITGLLTAESNRAAAMAIVPKQPEIPPVERTGTGTRVTQTPPDELPEES